MTQAVQAPLPLYLGLDGQRLQNGYLYFGVAELNPETNPVQMFWDAALTQPAAQPIRTINGMPDRNGTPSMLYTNADHSLTIRDSAGRLVLYARNSLEYTLENQLANTAQTFYGSGMVGHNFALNYAANTVGGSLNLGQTWVATDITKGDARVAVKLTLPNSAPTTQHEVNERREVFVGGTGADYPIDNTGATSVTALIEQMFAECAAQNKRKIVFNDGTYLFRCDRNDAQETAAVLINGLRNCDVVGTHNVNFIVGPGGVGAPEFAHFRLQGCKNVNFVGFKVTGNGISIVGTGPNRSKAFVLVTYDVNNLAVDLPEVNENIKFINLKINDIGGGVAIGRRSQSLPQQRLTLGVHVLYCEMNNLLGVDHGVAFTYTRGGTVFGSRFVNDITTVTVQDNMSVDVSTGSEDVLVENNYTYGFMFGSKCESISTGGPGGNEVRAARNVKFIGNRYDQIGHPTILIVPGPSGGGTYGLKINGIDCHGSYNVVTARTVGVTTGGLLQAFLLTNNHNSESVNSLIHNRGFGAQIGLNHNNSVAQAANCTAVVENNRFTDSVTFGMILQAGVRAEKNFVVRSGDSAIVLQAPFLTYANNNTLIDCCSTLNPITGTRVVVYQDTTGSVGYFELRDNDIFDSRGPGVAAQHAYFLRAGSTYSNVYVFEPGITTGMLVAISFDQYFSAVGRSLNVAGLNTPAPREFWTTNNPGITVPWSTMSWNPGDIGWFYPPTVGLPRGYVRTVAGTWQALPVL
jgi:hypothetical protein